MSKIKTALYSSLPGKEAQEIMAPHPKIIEGVEGIHHGPPVSSAVMILIIPDADDLSITFIKRTNKGKYHGGQIALPGGRTEESDNNPIETALRECQEEIGVPPEEIFILGTLSEIYIPLSNYIINPVVGTVLRKPVFSLCEDEVQQILLFRMADLFHPAHKTSSTFLRHEQEIVAPGYHIGGEFIWGATAMIISEMEHIMKNNILHIRTLDTTQADNS